MQFDELQALCVRSGWTVAKVFREKVSGTNATNDRAALQDLLINARQRQFEKVLVWSVDRLGRSMQQLVNVLSELKECGVQLLSYRQAIDTSTPMGAMLWQFLGIFAEFEHGLRRERQVAGIARAKANGVKFGRPPISKNQEEAIIKLRSRGMGINKIGRILGVGSGTVSRIVTAPA